MFCSNCGKEAQGNFCWSCGSCLAAGSEAAHRPDDIVAVEFDWIRCTDYQTLLRVPAVRDRIAASAAQCNAKFTGEQFLECCDKVLGSLTGGAPLTLIASIAQPISERLGLKMSKTQREQLSEPAGSVIVGVLASMARNGQKLLKVNQGEYGCTLHAAMPSDMWSLKGDLLVEVRAQSDSTFVEAGLTIPGQVYDWGKSQRALRRLFDDLSQLSRAA